MSNMKIDLLENFNEFDSSDNQQVVQLETSHIYFGSVTHKNRAEMVSFFFSFLIVSLVCVLNCFLYKNVLTILFTDIFLLKLLRKGDAVNAIYRDGITYRGTVMDFPPNPGMLIRQK